MKRIIVTLSIVAAVLSACSKAYDPTQLDEEIAKLEERAEDLVSLANRINTNITALKGLSEAVKDNLRITAIEEVKEGDVLVGYKLTLTDGSDLTVYVGKDGLDGEDGLDGKPGYEGTDGYVGQDGKVPVVGMKEFEGKQYWTLNGEFLILDGNKVPVVAQTGEQVDGKTPEIKIENGVWYYRLGNSEWIPVTVSAVWGDGNIFASVEQDGDYVIFNLADGEPIKVLKARKLTLALDKTGTLEVSMSSPAVVNYTLTADEENVEVEAFANGFWKTQVSGTQITVTAAGNAQVGETGQLVVFATAPSGLSVYRVLDLKVVE